MTQGRGFRVVRAILMTFFAVYFFLPLYALLQFSIDVDGQLLRFENGPPRSKELLWPGPASTQKVLMRILPPGPTGVGAEIHEGPFAWLRVLLRGDYGVVLGRQPGEARGQFYFSIGQAF